MQPQQELIITAKLLVTADRSPFEGGALLCRGDRIVAVDDLTSLKKNHPDVVVKDYGDAVILPLLVNAHTHLELTDFPDWANKKGRQVDEHKSFVDWILQLIQVKKKIDPDNYRHAVINGMEQSIRAGTGVVGDILAHHSARSAYQSAPLAGVVFLETLGQDPAMIRRLKKSLHQVLDEPFAAETMLGISPHSPYTISNVYLRHIYDLCKRRGLRCCTHVAESEEEVTFTRDSRGAIAERFYQAINWQGFIPPPSGLRPVTYLEKLGGLFPENLLVHGVHLDDRDISLLARNRMSLALCPRSNERLKVGKAPVGLLLKAGVNLALGTDSLASNDSLSIWDEMHFAAHWFAGELDAPTIFSMATQQGADALGVGKDYGSLSAGKRSSFQIVSAPAGATAEVYEYFTSGIATDDIMQLYRDGIPQLSGVK
ncbi:amidohydrolase family protein [Pelovirga terrestris]|uniref:Amidohydrolase family protein n=1 Tax=Pelovirga terrestris TaxID=2771352 RepID=A0A8J6UN88_9BACT|nr:amidohydrolase family protein [Pelovirga terrestris]MBD1399104.1 amidohydrolase family protein [Pelovirga terrestris]